MNEKANGSVPPWLAALGIKPGEYFSDAKPRLQRSMKARCFPPAARIYACLGLHTMCFQQEKAVKLVAGKPVELTPSDVASMTGILKQNIRRHILELREWGLADIKNSTKGRVEMYAWVRPRPVADSVKEENGNRARLPFLEAQGAPDWLDPLIKRFKIKLPEDFVITPDYLSAVGAAARDYQEAQMVLTRTLNGNRAPERINKEERNERNIERNGDGPHPPPLPTVVEKADEEEPPTSTDVALRSPAPPTFEDFKTLYPPQALDAPKAKPVFEAKSPPEKVKCIERLLVYRECARWQQNPQYIPLASNWLQSAYEEPPPPLIDFAAEKTNGKIAEKGRHIQRIAAMADAMRRKT